MALAIFILLTHTVFYQQLQPSSLVPQLAFSLSLSLLPFLSLSLSLSLRLEEFKLKTSWKLRIRDIFTATQLSDADMRASGSETLRERWNLTALCG